VLILSQIDGILIRVRQGMLILVLIDGILIHVRLIHSPLGMVGALKE
jgi:hypothetical protein